MALGVSLQGCPREVRLLLAGPYYFDVDMVNSLPNVARQLGRRGMVRETSLQVLSKLCSERDSVLKDIVRSSSSTGSSTRLRRGSRRETGLRIIAHSPLGYCTAVATRRWYWGPTYKRGILTILLSRLVRSRRRQCTVYCVAFSLLT